MCICVGWVNRNSWGREKAYVRLLWWQIPPIWHDCGVDGWLPGRLQSRQKSQNNCTFFFILPAITSSRKLEDNEIQAIWVLKSSKECYSLLGTVLRTTAPKMPCAPLATRRRKEMKSFTNFYLLCEASGSHSATMQLWQRIGGSELSPEHHIRQVPSLNF